MRFWMIALLVPVLSGCFTTTNEKIDVRRTEEELARVRQRETQTAETVREQLFQANQKRRLNRELFSSEVSRQEELKKIRAFLKRVPDDPWTSYEQDRRATFYRKWAGVTTGLPPLVAEGSGPPGWIGPKLPGAVAGSPVVEGLGEDEEGLGGDEGGGDEEGDYGEDEGDYGDEEEGDYGDEDDY